MAYDVGDAYAEVAESGARLQVSGVPDWAQPEDGIPHDSPVDRDRTPMEVAAGRLSDSIGRVNERVKALTGRLAPVLSRAPGEAASGVVESLAEPVSSRGSLTSHIDQSARELDRVGEALAGLLHRLDL